MKYSLNNFITLIHSDVQNKRVNNAIKKVLHLAISTEDLEIYTQTSVFLEWLDLHISDTENVVKRTTSLLETIITILRKNYTEKESANLIQITDLKKAYSQSAFAIGPINLEIKEGEVVGFVGENGNGKTTLLRSICGELNPTAGSLNYNVYSKNRYNLRTKLIYIPQRPNVWKGGLYENLQFTASCYKVNPKLNKLLVEITIAMLGLRKYQKLEWGALSSGYKMRFELARAFVSMPKVLIIDEPLANLDIVAQQVVLEDLNWLAKSPIRPIGVILSSQQLYEVEKIADNLIFLKYGEQQTIEKGENNTTNLVVELETKATYEELYDIFKSYDVISLDLNGGSFIAEFPSNHSFMDIQKSLLDHTVSISYIRDITNSTRKLFIK